MGISWYLSIAHNTGLHFLKEAQAGKAVQSCQEARAQCAATKSAASAYSAADPRTIPEDHYWMDADLRQMADSAYTQVLALALALLAVQP